MRQAVITFSISLLTLFVVLSHSQAERIKDLSSLAGIRDNQLVGYGLVVGLDGTGDKTKFTMQSLKNMLTRFRINLPPKIKVDSKNVAAVAVHAKLPPFAKPGQKIDVTVSSLGDAKSLRGGSLLMTSLTGIDGNVYAIAQGNLMVGGLGISGADGSKVTVNVPSVGRIPGGATIERGVPNSFASGDAFILNLHRPDFTAVYRIAETINRTFGEGTAHPEDGASIRIGVPEDISQRVAFVSAVENLTVDPGEGPARVVINSRTGTIVIGNRVQVMPVAVSHGNLVVIVSEKPYVSQPEPFSRRGTTVVVPESEIQVLESKKPMFLFNPGASLEEIVRAVNQVGATPSDLAAILEAFKAVGALRAELVII